MSTHGDRIECAVLCVTIVIGALLNGAFNGLFAWVHLNGSFQELKNKGYILLCPLLFCAKNIFLYAAFFNF